MEELLKDKHEEIAAIIVEPLMQGAGGMITMPKGYLKGLRNLCTKYNVLFITDEVGLVLRTVFVHLDSRKRFNRRIFLQTL